MIAGASSGNLAISFQDTSYEYLTCRRPKSRNIAFLSPHPPVFGPHAPADRAVVIIGFDDRGSLGSHGKSRRPINGTLRGSAPEQTGSRMRQLTCGRLGGKWKRRRIWWLAFCSVPWPRAPCAAPHAHEDYTHEAVRHSVGEYVRGQAHTNGIESFWSMLKRAHMGTFHKLSPKHLHRYVTEFAGRKNVRNEDTITQMTMLARGLDGKLMPWKRLTAGPRAAGPAPKTA